MSTEVLGPRATVVRASGSTDLPVPPWLSFSARWPCVTTPCQSIVCANGSAPVTLGSNVNQTGSMMPMTSYQSARLVSYTAETLSVSPLRTATRQSGLVNVIDASHET